MNKLLTCLIAAIPVMGLAKDPDSSAVKFAATITKADLKKHLSILASDEYEGRETGFKGQKMAASYIETQFKNFGLLGKVDGKSYQQSFPILIEKAGSTTLSFGGEQAEFLKNFFYVGSFAEGELTASSILFAGYGIDDAAYSDYAQLDVKDKFIFVLDGFPKDKQGNNILSESTISAWSADRLKKIKVAQEKGAKAIFIITPDYDKRVGQFKAFILNPKIRLKKPVSAAKKAALPYFYVSDELVTKLFTAKGKDLGKSIAKISKSKKPLSFDLPLNVSLNIKSDIKETTSENVLGFVEGGDLKEELVVVTAHYDHIGMQGDKVFNGADDDGSGTVAVIEMAEAFAKAKAEGKGPRRSMLFMTVSGEEKGLLGSEWYTDNPVWPLDKTVCDLNIDMIGRQDKQHATNGDYIYLIGSDKLSSELHFISEDCNRTYTKLDLDYTYNAPNDPNRFYYRSDHYNFAKNNIPVIFYFNGVHEDYHQETDEVDKINFDKMEKITRLVFHTAWDVANRDKKLVVDRQNDFKN